jgi:hypothetical protein
MASAGSSTPSSRTPSLGPDPLAGLSRLLSAVEWASGSPAPWTAEIREASVYVEVGLADFGNPDLIIVCTGGDGVLGGQGKTGHSLTLQNRPFPVSGLEAK